MISEMSILLIFLKLRVNRFKVDGNFQVDEFDVKNRVKYFERDVDFMITT